MDASIDLPTEILQEIGLYVAGIDAHHRSLCFLAQTCRWLYNTFKPHLDDHYIKCISARHPRFLKKLMVETENHYRGGQTVTQESLFNGYYKDLCFEIRGMLAFDDLRCFRNFICRATSIKMITVNFDLDSRVLACFLNACVQRPGLDLRANQVTRDPIEVTMFLYHEHKPTLKKFSLLRPFRGVKTIQNSSIIVTEDAEQHSSCRVVPQQCRVVPLPRSPPLLTSFHIFGHYFFSTDIYPWTQHILNSAPLTCLSLDVCQYDDYLWSYILPSIFIPTLTYLILGRVRINMRDLQLFLNRHPSLETLKLHGVGICLPRRLPKSDNRLSPGLKKLIGRPCYVHTFINYHKQGYFPQLTTFVVIPWPIHDDGVECFSIFNCISDGDFRNLNLTLCWGSARLLVQWLGFPLDKTSKNGIRRLPGIENLVLGYGQGRFIDLADMPNTREWARIKLGISVPLAIQDDRPLLEAVFRRVCPSLQSIVFQ